MTAEIDKLDRMARGMAQIVRDHDDEKKRRDVRENWRKREVAAEVDAHLQEQKSSSRRTTTIALVCASMLGGVFAWSYSLIAAEHHKQIEDATRLQRIDADVSAAATATRKTADNLKAHEGDFDAFRQEQRRAGEAERLGRQRQSLMLEQTLRSLGRRPHPKTPEQRTAEVAAGWAPAPR